MRSDRDFSWIFDLFCLELNDDDDDHDADHDYISVGNLGSQSGGRKSPFGTTKNGSSLENMAMACWEIPSLSWEIIHEWLHACFGILSFDIF